VLKNRTMKKRFIENSINQMMKKMKKLIHLNDDLKQLSTSLESSFFQHLSSQIISLRFELTEDDRISRFQSFDAEDAAESFYVIVRRKDKEKKSQLFEFDQLFAIDQTSLDVTKIQIDLKNHSFSRNIESVDLNEANILSDDQKRTEKLINKYAQIV
jgi:adenylyl- and sulfurtransferase ThiI